MNMDDKKRLDWLEGTGGYALVSDDAGHWACVCDGFQNLPLSDEPEDIQTTFFLEADKWHNTIREAIDAAITGMGD